MAEETPEEHFTVTVVEAIIETHPDATSLEVARIGGYMSVVKKGSFQTGDHVAYIPEFSLIPTNLLVQYVKDGILPPAALGEYAGAADYSEVQEAQLKPFRIKPVKLRGVLSQGVVVKAQDNWALGQDVKDILGVTKWEPTHLPEHMVAGKTYFAGNDRCMKYDIENYKKYPHVLQDGEDVVFTEKIHGTWCQVGIMCAGMEHHTHGRVIVSSKGLASKGMALVMTKDEAGRFPWYVQVATSFDIEKKVDQYFQSQIQDHTSVFVLGEIFGSGVQDLSYGAQSKDDRLGFRVFDIFLSNKKDGSGRYLNDEELDQAAAGMGLSRVPMLYRGPFSKKVLDEYTNGKETVSGKGLHIREGVVVRPVKERWDSKLGRVQLKSVSEKYLLRANGTEFH